MTQATGTGESGTRPAINTGLWLALAILAFAAVGCTGTTVPREPHPTPISDAAEYRSEGIRLQLVGALRAGDPGSLIEDPGWAEYVLAIDNISGDSLTIYNVKLLNQEGRYLDSAASYEQITAPPDVATDVTGTVATSAAGVAAGQVIPYGGTIVGIISGALSASTIQSKGDAKRAFGVRKLKVVELAPDGRVTGSAFLPAVVGAKALVVDYGYGNARKRIEISLSGS